DGKVPAMYAQLAETWVMLAIAAAATKQIKLGTGILLLAQHNVIDTARASATLDLYSGGRLILGVGAGWSREEAEVMGVRFEQRWKQLRESVEALRILWTQEEARYAGDIIKFPALRVGPKPVQKPCPPIMLGAHDPKYALRRVARYADGWMPGGLSPDKAMESIAQIKRMAREYGRDPEQLQFSVALTMRRDEPTADTLKRYQSAGVSRIIVMATAAASVTESRRSVRSRHWSSAQRKFEILRRRHSPQEWYAVLASKIMSHASAIATSLTAVRL